MSEGGPDQYVAPPPFTPPHQRYGPAVWPPQQPYLGAGYQAAPPPPVPYGYPPAYAYGYPPARPPRPRPPLAFGTIGAAVGGVGAILLFAALLALPWFSVNSGLNAADVRSVLDDQADLANSLSVAYFSWFGWVLMLVAAGCAGLAVWPSYRLSTAFRLAGPIVTGFAVLLTLGACELTDSRFDVDDTYYFRHLSVGFWCALIGFVLLGIACIIGPRVSADATFQK